MFRVWFVEERHRGLYKIELQRLWCRGRARSRNPFGGPWMSRRSERPSLRQCCGVFFQMFPLLIVPNSVMPRISVEVQARKFLDGGERRVECRQLQKQRLLCESEGAPLGYMGKRRLLGRSLKPPFLRFGASAVCEPAHLLIPDISAPAQKSSRSLAYSQVHLCPFFFSSSPDSWY